MVYLNMKNGRNIEEAKQKLPLYETSLGNGDNYKLV